MGDIDFDELDKAVNNLMGNVKSSKDKDEAPKAKTLEVKDTLKPGEEPEYGKIGDAAQKIGSEALVTEREHTLVEHFETTESPDKPEYDKLGEVAQKIGSETLESNDKADDKKSPEQPEKPAIDEKPEDVTPPVVAAAPTAKRAAGGRFMDVVHPSSDMKTAPAPKSPSVSRRTLTPPAAPIVVPTETEDPAASTPFLPDVKDKVEKRPLGAVPSPFTDEPEKDDKPVEAPASDEPESPPDEPAETTLINNEGREELAEKEKLKDEQQSIDVTDLPDESSPEEKLLQEIESTEVKEEPIKEEEPSPQDETLTKVESADTGHIRDEVKKGNAVKTEDAGIYDVDQYHKPIDRPQKQKSGWGKVVIIILIIIIFAAAGGAAYFLLG